MKDTILSESTETQDGKPVGRRGVAVILAIFLVTYVIYYLVLIDRLGNYFSAVLRHFEFARPLFRFFKSLF